MKTKNADLLMQSWVCSQLIKGPVNGFINTFAKEFNLSRPVASRIVKQLVADDRIILSGSPRKPIYSLGTTRSILSYLSTRRSGRRYEMDPGFCTLL